MTGCPDHLAQLLVIGTRRDIGDNESATNEPHVGVDGREVLHVIPSSPLPFLTSTITSEHSKMEGLEDQPTNRDPYDDPSYPCTLS